MATIYISSTYSDLAECRERVHQALRRAGHHVIAMEDYVATDQRPLDKCRKDVASCDVYVGIVAHRYGFVPEDGNPEGRSITELEYEEAGRAGTPRLLFVLREDADWPLTQTDMYRREGDNGECVQRFRERVGDECTISFFSEPQELATLVSVAVAKRLAASSGAGVAGDAGGQRLTEALGQYYIWLEQRCQRLDLDALTPPEREECLQLELRQIFVEQDTRADPPPVELPKSAWEHLRATGEMSSDAMAEARLREVRQAQETYQRKPRRRVLDVLTDSNARRAVVLGDPGSGKSTLARYLVLSLAERIEDSRLRDMFEGHLPLLIELRVYAGVRAEHRCESFLEFIEHLGHTYPFRCWLVEGARERR